ncbi:MAG: ribosome silencing factor [Candidatus Thioglobus sp.]|jgi:ribosome-associated protein|uniref:Iojap protein n=1 Tax=hydrothermal vent metagenome TaxID=652676 RepID=A0A1W1DKJ8_9ZZZZ|nr:MAG: ribosome silencing factor [Candidatus Thioglobus sp.]RUM82260.1 MAG: ribosome silencing factor [Candidatus Thioglobus sp.]RUM83208.1 MAG: ribosome silencing factor [Candidatus Thioglobus sp.]
MKLKEQLKVVTDTIEELKGEDIITLKVLEQSADIEAIVVATGRSIQHVRGIANNIKIEAKRLGMKVVGIEGTETGHWVLVDLAEVVVHVMTEKTREFYKLERLWSGSERSDD